MTTHVSSSSQGWLASLEARADSKNRLMAIPESMTDPFSSLQRRLEEVIDSYKFTREPRSLLEWATSQTGMSDPLAAFNRQELEQAFPFYCHRRDACLRDIIGQMKRSGQTGIVQKLANDTQSATARRAISEALRSP